MTSAESETRAASHASDVNSGGVISSSLRTKSSIPPKFGLVAPT